MNGDLFHLDVYEVTSRQFVKASILYQSVPPEEYKPGRTPTLVQILSDKWRMTESVLTENYINKCVWIQLNQTEPFLNDSTNRVRRTSEL